MNNSKTLQIWKQVDNYYLLYMTKMGWAGTDKQNGRFQRTRSGGRQVKSIRISREVTMLVREESQLCRLWQLAVTKPSFTHMKKSHRIHNGIPGPETLQGRVEDDGKLLVCLGNQTPVIHEEELGVQERNRGVVQGTEFIFTDFGWAL